MIDLTGKQFDNWIVVGLYCHGNHHAPVFWLCRCKCGATGYISTPSLTCGNSKGCVKCGHEKLRGNEHGLTHGLTRNNTTPVVYYIWVNMRRRCHVKTGAGYKNYGARGIKVCEEWRHSYTSFRNWALEHGYEKGLTIDRINNDGDYCPENCRWATQKQQQRNRRDNKYITIDGITKILEDWAQGAGLSSGTVSYRVRKGWPNEDLFAPCHSMRHHIIPEGK